MKNLIRGLVVGVIAAGVTIVNGGPALAHTLTGDANCTRVEGRMASAPADFTSKITVTVGAATATQTRDGNHSLSLPTPQGGATTVWTVRIDGEGSQYDRTFTGTVGPCGDVVVETPLFPFPTPPTCDTAGTLTVDPPDPALHSTTTVNGAPLTATTVYGPGTYTITHTSDEGYEYGNDLTTASLTITVAGQLTEGCDTNPTPPTPLPPVPPVPDPYECPEGTTWTDADGDGVVDRGECEKKREPRVNNLLVGLNVGCFMAVARLKVDKDDKGHRMIVSNQNGRVLLSKWIKPGTDRWYDIRNVRPGDTITVTVKDKPGIERSDFKPRRGCKIGS